MCHISELAEGYVKSVSDVVRIGDVVKVKVVLIDDQGRIKLSRKAAIAEEGVPAGAMAAGETLTGVPGQDSGPGGGGGDRGGGGGGGGGGRAGPPPGAAEIAIGADRPDANPDAVRVFHENQPCPGPLGRGICF